MALKFLNRVAVVIETTGQGTVTLGAVISNQFFTPAEAGIANGDTSYWMLTEGTDVEIFLGTYLSSGPTVSRDTVLVSKIGGVAGTTKMTLAGTAVLRAVSPAFVAQYAVEKDLIIAVSDENSLLVAGTAKITFRMPHAMTLTAVRANVNTAPTGSTIIVDINKNGTTILSTKLSIDASEETSVSAATPPVISVPALADDDEITIDIDQVGSTVAGRGLKVLLKGYRS